MVVSHNRLSLVVIGFFKESEIYLGNNNLLVLPKKIPHVRHHEDGTPVKPHEYLEHHVAYEVVLAHLYSVSLCLFINMQQIKLK